MGTEAKRTWGNCIPASGVSKFKDSKGEVCLVYLKGSRKVTKTRLEQMTKLWSVDQGVEPKPGRGSLLSHAK